MTEQAIDYDTGEILEQEHDLSVVANLLYEANQQIKAWETYANGLKAILLAQQQERKVVYGTVVASVRQAVRKILDVPMFIDRLEGLMLTSSKSWDIICAATGFDRDKLPKFAVEHYDGSSERKPSAPYVVVEPLRVNAPKLREVSE